MIQPCVSSLAQTYIIHMHMYSLLLILHPPRHQSTCSFMYEFILLSFIHPSIHPCMQSPICGCFSLSSTHLPTSMYSVLNLWGCLPLFPTHPYIHQTMYSRVHECFFSQPFNHPLSIHPWIYLCMHVWHTFSFSYPPIHSSIHLSTHTTINLLIYAWRLSYSSSQQANQVLICRCFSIYHPSIHLYILCHLGFCWQRSKEKDK